MSSFSQIVDELILESLRTTQVSQIASWLNQTVREAHFTNDKMPGTSQPVKYGANLIEDRLTADVETGFIWTIPNLTRFQLMAAVYYPSYDKYATNTSPGTIHLDSDDVDAGYTFYRTGDAFAFAGYAGLDDDIDIAYYEYPRRLKYYPPGNTRPAEYDEGTETWSYPAGAATDQEKEDARNLSTNWLLMRWKELMMQGTRAKIYARSGDMDKNKLAYASFESLRPGLIAAESQEFAGFYRR